jgi:hypothetical protein
MAAPSAVPWADQLVHYLADKMVEPSADLSADRLAIVLAGQWDDQ